ncbi:M14 family metallocarboxypeptidase [Vibrio alginolyticus]
MKSGYIYPIGTPGQPWNEEERKAWLATQEVKRSYQDEVVSKIDALRERFDVEQYGALSYNEARFPLFCIKTRNWDSTKPAVLVTGGVHGYETSGVHGALKFVETEAERYAEYFNIVIAPCVSPWGYEVINRWNPNAIDPNRSFYKDSPAEESANLIKLVATLGDVLMHIDLHETTDSDETEFRPALAAPPVVQFGVINYPMVKLGLCGGVTNCVYGTTTEVYPDSPTVTDEECNDAQVAAVVGGLNYVLAQL